MGRLRLVSWNVLADAYLWPHLYGRCDPAALDPFLRRARILERIAGFDADVVALQEAEPALVDALRERYGGAHVHFAQKGCGKPDGCAFVLRVPLEAARVEVLSYDDGTGHVAALAGLDGISIATTHLKWDPDDVAERERAGLLEARALAAWLPRDGHRVVCGDLNAVAGGPVVRALTDAGLHDAHAAAPAPTAVANGRARRIDFILASPGLGAIPEPSVPLHDDDVLPSLELPSDHVPIAVTLTGV